MDVYICSPLKNAELNQSIAKNLKSHGISVYLPERHTNQTAGPDEIFRSNIEAIKKARIIIAVLKNYGRDFGFEIGFTYGLKKKIIGYAEDESYNDDFMIRGALDTIVSTIDLVVAHIKNLLGYD